MDCRVKPGNDAAGDALSGQKLKRKAFQHVRRHTRAAYPSVFTKLPKRNKRVSWKVASHRFIQAGRPTGPTQPDGGLRPVLSSPLSVGRFAPVASDRKTGIVRRSFRPDIYQGSLKQLLKAIGVDLAQRRSGTRFLR
jgi:hypothetical protein